MKVKAEPAANVSVNGWVFGTSLIYGEDSALVGDIFVGYDWCAGRFIYGGGINVERESGGCCPGIF